MVEHGVGKMRSSGGEGRSKTRRKRVKEDEGGRAGNVSCIANRGFNKPLGFPTTHHCGGVSPILRW